MQPVISVQIHYLWIFIRRCLCVGFYLFLLTGCNQNESLKWVNNGDHRWAKVDAGFFNDTGFEKINNSQTKIDVQNIITEDQIEENRNFLNGSGVAAADIDNDGLVDLYFAQMKGPNKMYKNMGNFEFKDVTEKSGLAHAGYHSTGVVFVDIDGDRDSDLLVSSLMERNVLYINDGNGHFKIKKNSGLGASHGSNTMTLADIDSDGDLDLYITNYKAKRARDIFSDRELAHRNTIVQEGDSYRVREPYDSHYDILHTDKRLSRVELGSRDELYINNGNATFKKITNTQAHFLDADGKPMGLKPDWGLSAKFQDVNNDLLPDLYVANDFSSPDRFWINQGNAIFKHVDDQTLPNMSYSSMGVDYSDINRDGQVDIFVSEMLSSNYQRRAVQLSQNLEAIEGWSPFGQYNRNSLYLGTEANYYYEISNYANLAATEWSWATQFLDVDLDGYEDLIITTGYLFDYLNMDTQLRINRETMNTMRPPKEDLTRYPPLILKNKLYHNNGDLTFTDKSGEWGFIEKDISLGLAVADLDNDGDPDIAINKLNGPSTIYKNTSGRSRIAVRLQGNSPNTDGIGAKIFLEGAGIKQSKEISSGGTYVSGSQPMAYFAANPKQTNHKITVIWRGGKQTVIDSVKANRIYEIDPTQSKLQEAKQKIITPPLFTDISDKIKHRHHANEAKEPNIQRLLPILNNRREIETFWLDFNNDGYNDLFISGDRVNKPSIYINNRGIGFEHVELPLNTKWLQNKNIQSELLAWEAGNTIILVIANAYANNNLTKDPLVTIYKYNKISGKWTVDGTLISSPQAIGAMAAADYNNDGYLDLFIGGYAVKGRYPVSTQSRLYTYNNGQFNLDENNLEVLSKLGVVSDAIFTDYDRDGDQDLIISREWDSIKLLSNVNNNFKDISSTVGLDKFKGWWTDLTTGDFNNDGYIDFFAANLGTNSRYQLTENKPLRLYYGDLNGNGIVEIIDSFYSVENAGYVPRRPLEDFMEITDIYRNIRSYQEFSSKTVSQLFKESKSKISYKEINKLTHTLFLNKKNHFQVSELQHVKEAQFSPVYSATVADFNNDGNEDIYLSQSSPVFTTGIQSEASGRGLILAGKGDATFNLLNTFESGVNIYGNQRVASVNDINNNGKLDLLVTQYNRSTKLYKNRNTSPGLQLNLVGKESNPGAIGTSVRAVYKEGIKGPVKEIQAGEDYRVDLTLGRVQDIVAVEILWYNGNREVVNLKAGTTKKVIKY